MDSQNQSPLEDNDDNSLEKPDVVVERSEEGQPAKITEDEAPKENTQPPTPATGAPAPTEPTEEPHHKFENIKNKLSDLNVYLLGFIFLFLASAAVVVVVVIKAPKSSVTNKTIPQSLSESQLQQLAANSQTIGDSSQVLNIGANSIFKGQVLVQKDLNVAGNIKIGGSLNLPGISVSGGAKFAQIQTNKLSVSGNTTLSGQLVSSSGIDIAGASTFSGPLSAGTLNVQNLQLSGNLNINNHVVTGGNKPTRTTGSAVGSGGTSSINGSDTAGNVKVNTGSSPSIGCLITVNFAQSFSSTPNVVITPVGSAAGSLEYYVNTSTTGFSVCTDSAAGAGQSFGFDYIVFD